MHRSDWNAPPQHTKAIECDAHFVDLHIGAPLPHYVQNGCVVCKHNVIIDNCKKCNESEWHQYVCQHTGKVTHFSPK